MEEVFLMPVECSAREFCCCRRVFKLRQAGLSTVPENRPAKKTARTLREELLFQRAAQTYLWACH